MKKQLPFLLLVLSLSALVSCTPATTSSSSAATSSVFTPTLTAKTVDFYYGSAALKDKATLYFKTNASDFPYVKLDNEMFYLFDTCLGYPTTSMTISSSDNKVTITNPKEATVVVNFSNQSVTYSDYNLFNSRLYGSTPLDGVAWPGVNDAGEKEYIERESGSFYLAGENEARVLDLGAYHIPMIYEDGAGYLPLATFSDIFLGPNNGGFVYNGEATFFFGDFAAIASAYYTPTPTGKVSEQLATFNYNELCFNFDAFYGLFKKRGLTNFDTYFGQLGLKSDMLSTSTLTSETASAKAMFQGFSEGHSGFTAPSAYTGTTFNPFDESFFGPSFAAHSADQAAFAKARADYLGTDFLPYQEIGKTAYITFDHFLGNAVDYYANPITSVDQTTDTVGLVQYAHKKIQEDKIEKVVLDLSNNGGGAVDAAAYLGAWMTGESSINICDAVTGSKGTTLYKADVNGDHKFDDSDTIKDKKLYCLISPVSFSCGNLVPFMFKTAGNVTLLGQTTGGGACEVQKLANAIGATGQFSGHNVICSLKNGIYQDVDDGVDPHVWLNDKASYYKRVELTAYLDTLK